MSAIGDYSDVLNDHMIAAWPRLAAALEGLDCALMGGTAVAMVLRHRHSHDFDFMTLQPFDSRAVAAKLLSAAAHAAYKDDDRPAIAKVAFDGVPVTVMRDLRGFVKPATPPNLLTAASSTASPSGRSRTSWPPNSK